MSKRRLPNKFAVRYTNDGKHVDYVDRTAPELQQELQRVQQAVSNTMRILAPLQRLHHPVLTSVYTQLRYVLADLPENAAPEQQATEIARLSFVMEQTANLLDTISNSRVKNLQEARFTLTYGRAPKKRDPSIFKNKPRGQREEGEVDDPEGYAGDDPADD